MKTEGIFETKLRINIRPLVFAYFILDGDYKNLRRAITLACTQWGGIRHLIIPVQKDKTILPIFEEYIKVRQPEYFVSYLPQEINDDADKNKILEGRLSILCPYQHTKLLWGPQYEDDDKAAHPLHVLSKNEVRHSVLTIFDYEGSEIEKTLLLAMFGTVPKNQVDDYAKFISINHGDLSLEHEQLLLKQSYSHLTASPLNMTTSHLRTYQTGAIDPISFKVVVGDDINTICVYWNLRAIIESATFEDVDRRTILLPMQLINRDHLLLLTDIIRKSKPVEGQSSDIDIAFIIINQEYGDITLDKLKEVDGIEQMDGTSISCHTWIGHPDKIPREINPNRILKYYFMPPNFCCSKSLTRSGRTLDNKEVFKIGKNEIRYYPPDNFVLREYSAVAVDFDCDIWNRYPKNNAVSGLISPNSRFSNYGLSCAKVAMAIPRIPFDIKIDLPTDMEAIKIYFSDKGYEIKISRSGQYANAMINLIGGIKEANILNSRLAYNLLNTLAMKSSKKVAQRIIKEFKASKIDEEDLSKLLVDFEVIPELKRIVKTSEQLQSLNNCLQKDILNLLEVFVEKQILKRGSYIECPNCNTPSWYPLESISEYITCTGCSHRFVFPVKAANGKEIQWEYTLNTIVNRVMDQDTLSHIFALYHLTKEKKAYSIIPGLELFPKGEKEAIGEFDFIFVMDQKLYAGECKSGSILTEKDYKMAALAVEFGFDTFHFCSLGKFSADTENKIETFTQNNKEIKIEILTEKELFV
ncbi:hypothetical protein ACFL02_03925 [Planctomycetota bacterium]